MFELMRRSPTLGLSRPTDTLFDSFFDDLFEPLRLPQAGLKVPTIDVYSDNDKTMVVEMQAPGLDRKDLTISVNNGVLEIRGERTEKEEHKDKKRSYVVRESNYSFARQIVLPEGADSEKIAAELQKGILKVTIPVERPQPKRIEIAAPKTKHNARLASSTKTKTES